ncbi:MAG: C69 family dipeptidase [Holophagaceae bacterium]|nr:C69 family dipeptidase [Holophagaceae bacterium]
MKLEKVFFLLIAVGMPLLPQVAPNVGRMPVPPIAPMVTPDEILGEGCTSILVGRLASVDGSTMTSHSCDSGTDRTWMNIVARAKHPKGAMVNLIENPKRTKGLNDPSAKVAGKIPQVDETFSYLNAAYPIMNEYQLAIGETTVGGRRELVSKAGLLDAPELYRLVLERAKTAREAIKIIDELTKAHGYNDSGECFTFADKDECWLFEIYGPGKDKIGAVWAAVRVPDDEITVSANASRIRQLDLNKKDWFLASSNVHSLAREQGWWVEGEPFDFAYAYAPSSRVSLACRLREWRVLSILAPSLNLNPHSENHPFSIKPEKKVSVQDILAIFRDSYQGTEFDQIAGMYKVDSKKEATVNPVANPFAHSDLKIALNIPRYRTIAVPQSTYLTVTQSRNWLPDSIGGVVWLGYDNPATTPHMPFYAGISKVPASYEVDGRREYSKDCAWWAFRTPSKLAHFRYQEMSLDIIEVMNGIETKLFENQAEIEAEALRIHNQNPTAAKKFLTDYCVKEAESAVSAYWKLSDALWQKYSGRF